MKRVTWYTIVDMLLILMAVLLIIWSCGCDPLDPKNSVNAIYIEEETELTMDRFTKVYVSEENSMEISIYKDNEYPGCELITVCQSRGGNRFGLSIEYVVHPLRDWEKMNDLNKEGR